MFLLFAGENYHPEGGSRDFRGEFETIEQAKSWFRDHRSEINDNYDDDGVLDEDIENIDIWADILNKENMKSVAYGTIRWVDGPIEVVYQKSFDGAGFRRGAHQELEEWFPHALYFKD